MFFGLLFIAFTSTRDVLARYSRGQSICPIVSEGREWLRWSDAGIFYILKDEMAGWCDAEDSYWLLFIDAWFRSIVHGTDSWWLLLIMLKKSMAFFFTLILVITPCLAMAYAFVSVVVTRLEIAYMPECKPLESVVARVTSLQRGLYAKFMTREPPKTLRRMRPSQHAIDAMVYCQGRLFRIWNFQRAATKSLLNTFLVFAVVCVTLFRISCLIFPVGAFVRLSVQYFGLHDFSASGSSGLGESPMATTPDLHARISDWIFSAIASRTFSTLKAVLACVLPAVVLIMVALSPLGVKIRRDATAFHKTWPEIKKKCCIGMS